MADSNNAGAANDVDTLSFEDAFRNLAEMAQALESGGLTLAEATARYEDGMTLVRRCNRLLDEAELKITSLKDAFEAATDEGSDDGDEDIDEDRE